MATKNLDFVQSQNSAIQDILGRMRNYRGPERVMTDSSMYSPQASFQITPSMYQSNVGGIIDASKQRMQIGGDNLSMSDRYRRLLDERRTKYRTGLQTGQQSLYSTPTVTPIPGSTAYNKINKPVIESNTEQRYQELAPYFYMTGDAINSLRLKGGAPPEMSTWEYEQKVKEELEANPELARMLKYGGGVTDRSKTGRIGSGSMPSAPSRNREGTMV